MEGTGTKSTATTSVRDSEATSNHPRFIKEKFKSSGPCQAERRSKLLQLRKQMRYDYVNHLRRLAENDWSLDEAVPESTPMDEELRLNVEEMEWIAPYCKPPRFYRNQLMLSEWLIEVPEDLATEWCFALCPEGKRCLVVASKGKTIAYTKSGYRVNTFSSHLPGGNRESYQNYASNKYTIIDCVFNNQSKTFYVLDVLCWKGHPVIDSESEFRFFWLQSKFDETPELQEQSKVNPYAFVPLTKHPPTQETLSSVFRSVLPFDPIPLDGILFYHKRIHYLHGITPLVGWLKPYMLPEVLNVSVPELYASKPKNYTCFSDHLKVAISKRHLAPSAMEQGDAAEEETPT